MVSEHGRGQRHVVEVALQLRDLETAALVHANERLRVDRDLLDDQRLHTGIQETIDAEYFTFRFWVSMRR